jgi:obg-like ATPase 1
VLEEIGAFEDNRITHVEGSVDPVRDLNIIADELRLKDAEILEKLLINSQKSIKKTPNQRDLLFAHVLNC